MAAIFRYFLKMVGKVIPLKSTNIVVGILGVLLSLFCIFLMAKVHPMAAIGPAIGFMIGMAYIFYGVTGPLFFTLVLYLRPGEMIHPALEKLMLGKLTAVGCLGFWAIRFFLLRERNVSADILSKLMLGLTFSIVVSTFVKSSFPSWSKTNFSEVWSKLVILFFAIIHLSWKPRPFKSYVICMNLLTVILGYMGMHKGATAPPHELVEGNRVGLGTLFGDPNDYSQMLIVSGLAYFIYYIMYAKKRSTRWILYFCILGTIGGILSSRSRGAFLGIAGTAGIIARTRLNIVQLAVGGVAFGGMGAGLMAIAGRSTAAREEGKLDESSQGRIDAWKAAIKMYQVNPIFGVGYECYPFNYLAYVVNPVDPKPVKAVHNSWLKVIAELGTFGSIFFFPLILITLFRAWTLERWAIKHRVAESNQWALGCMLRSPLPALTGWCITGTFLSNCFTWFLYIQIAVVISASALVKHFGDEIIASLVFEKDSNKK